MLRARAGHAEIVAISRVYADAPSQPKAGPVAFDHEYAKKQKAMTGRWLDASLLQSKQCAYAECCVSWAKTLWTH